LRARLAGYLLLAPGLVAIVFFATALGALFRLSVLEFVPGSLRTGGVTAANFRAVLSAPYLRAIGDTALLSAATTILTLLASYPVAYALARARSGRVRSLLVLGSSLVSWPVRLLFEPSGVLVGLVHFSMPTMILILAAALAHVDPALERAAASLGARPARVFARVTLPLSMPGVVSGSLIVFAWTFSAFATPELLGGGRVKMIANVVKDLALDSFNWPASAAFAIVALAVTLALVAALGRLLTPRAS